MKQYDFVRAWVNDADYDIDGPVIVLTIEEAEKIWDMGRRAEVLKNNQDAKWTDFKSWMEYKGINI